MTLNDQRIAMCVAATHAAKQAIELVEAVARVGEHIGDPSRARSDTNALWAKGNIAAIRRELDDLEHLLAGREPPIKAAPKVAA